MLFLLIIVGILARHSFCLFRLDTELRKWIDTYPVDNTTKASSKLTDDSKLTAWPMMFSSNKKVKKNTLGRRAYGNGEMLVIFKLLTHARMKYIYKN